MPEKQQIRTIGDLINFLSTFPPNWSIAVPDRNGICREEIFVEISSISTVLTSKGEEVEW